MPKISKRKKLLRVIKRKLFKPLLYAVGISAVLYLIIGNVIITKRKAESIVPQFVISRISNEFDETEFMHMLLTIQELSREEDVAEELKEFANGPFPAGCPKLLEYQLAKMNWAPQAFLIRLKKFFEMHEAYERIIGYDETITFLKNELDTHTLPKSLYAQLKVLQQERDKLIGSEITLEEYNFIKEYNGLAVRLLKKEQR